MRRIPRDREVLLGLLLILGALLPVPVLAARGLGYADLMKVRKIVGAKISDDASWIVYALMPDRGDGEAVVRATQRNTEYRVLRGAAPEISHDGSWVAVRLEPSFAETETAKQEHGKKEEGPKPGCVLLRTSDGSTEQFDDVEEFSFSDDGRWLAVRFSPVEDEEGVERPGPDAPVKSSAVEKKPAGTAGAETKEEETKEEETAKEDTEEKEHEAGGTLLVRRLSDGQSFEIESVLRFAFDPTSHYLALATSTDDGQENGIFVRDLAHDLTERVLHRTANAAYPVLQWGEDLPRLAYLRGDEEEPGTILHIALHVFDASTGEDRELAGPGSMGEGWELPAKNELSFSAADTRLFVGLRPVKTAAPTAGEDRKAVARGGSAGVAAGSGPDAQPEEEPFDPYDLGAILADREVDVWHYEDPRIKPHEKKSFKERSEHLYRAVVHLEEALLVRLADETLPTIEVPKAGDTGLGRSEVPYLKLQTWDGFYQDLYAVDLHSGHRELLASKLQDTVSRSPNGRYFAWFSNGQWHLYDVADHRQRMLTEGLEVSFANEDHDYPRSAPDYGTGGWASDDSALLLYDKYDIWEFSTRESPPRRITEGRGRSERRIYRVVDADADKEGFDPGEMLLLSGFDELHKNSSWWHTKMGQPGLRKLREADKHFSFVAKAKEADRLLLKEESYAEFPDLWVADLDLGHRRKLSEANPQLADFDLGRAELVEWKSLDGIPLQGVLIKPAGYQPGRRYPVLVYFYRFFSQRLHLFNDPVINHRPSFYVYAGDGYCIFLPDIRFEVGRPGLSAAKCLVPGVQKLIDIGVADPDAVALHGHSWSGYQTAQIITLTDVFACAVAGAPVSNMTSAYGGIRWGTGLSRQFQYEKSQSRIGGSLWEARDLYIENSPVFFADRIHTPLLIEFGDEDEAVPWWQGIELYMAMRRLGKPCVMLEYRGEPHHLKKYPNKLDYSLKMKAFIDHFCKGSEAPAWWTEGVAYEED